MTSVKTRVNRNDDDDALPTSSSSSQCLKTELQKCTYFYQFYSSIWKEIVW